MIRSWFEYLVISRSGLFDARFYLRMYRDCRLADVDPLFHYIKFGWKEGRDPSNQFNTEYYLRSNPDVKEAGVNPLIHYIRHGKKEGRAPNPGGDIAAGLHPSRINYAPRITVIVPNYNHASYLEQRLDSIYNQTYQNIEVILLDDCSTDQSVGILKKYQAQHPDITRLYVNTTNTGGPFSQWKKGISLAAGELIWIAESDDTCDKEFLETLVPYFADDSILLSYAHTIFVDERGRKHSFAFEQYVSQIDAHKWDTSYISTAHEEVNNALGILNTIPNVSSAVFRRIDGNFPLLSDPSWLSMRVCGDWLFYLHLIQGGRIAYCRETHNYYRMHQAGASYRKTHVEDVYYQEHEMIALAVARLYKVPDELLRRSYQRLKDYYFQMVGEGTSTKFDSLFNLNKVLQTKSERVPNILMATFGFIYGGGEIFPIRLANAFKDKGLSVTVFNGDYGQQQQGVREMLYAHIPVIHNFSPEVNFMLEQFGIEIIHTHHASMENYFAHYRSNRPDHVKHVATMHGMYEMMEAFDLHTKQILKSVDYWFYTADKNVVPFKKRGIFLPEKFQKIDNGIQFPRPDPVDLSQFGITPNSFTACLASRALHEKGWKEAILAIQKAREATQNDLHLLLIGDGPYYDEIKDQKLPDYIHILGAQANVSDYLASSQLGLIPSYFKGESFPFYMIECFMAGLPVIASNVGEIANMITPDGERKAGIVIELKGGRVDPLELADAISKISSDKNFYDECARTAAGLKQRFNIAVVADQYINHYKQLVENIE